MGADPFRIRIRILNLILRHIELEASQNGHWISFVGQGSWFTYFYILEANRGLKLGIWLRWFDEIFSRHLEIFSWIRWIQKWKYIRSTKPKTPMSNGCLLHADRPSLDTQSCIKGFWWYGILLFGPVGQPGQYRKFLKILLKQVTFECSFFQISWAK